MQAVPLDKAEAKVPLYRTFANLNARVWQHPNETGRGEYIDDPASSFPERRFDDMESALLEFVRSHGFLGSPSWGADALSEPLDYLVQKQRQLSILFDFGLEHHLDGTPIDDQLNGVAPTLRLRVVSGQVQAVPETLEAYLYWRLAHDFCNGVDWRGERCPFCGIPIPRGRGAKRRQARFCCAKCRIYFFRRSARDRAVQIQTRPTSGQRN